MPRLIFPVVLCVFAGLTAPLNAADPPPPQAIQQLYEEAFQHYKAGEILQAMQKWNEVLRLDLEQRTARQMIQEARETMAKRNRELRSKLYRLIQNGQYHKALLSLQALLDEDPSNPQYKTLLSRLEELAAILPEIPSRTKPWRAAAKGLLALLSQPEDIPLAHNGLRYARELDSGEERFQRLYEWLLTLHPELVGADKVTPGMTLLEYKRSVGLNYIYEGKYHLAVDVFSEVLSLEPDDILTLKRLGSAYYALKRKKQALEIWSRAQRLAPNDDQLKKYIKKAQKRR